MDYNAGNLLGEINLKSEAIVDLLKMIVQQLEKQQKTLEAIEAHLDSLSDNAAEMNNEKP